MALFWSSRLQSRVSLIKKETSLLFSTRHVQIKQKIS